MNASGGDENDAESDVLNAKKAGSYLGMHQETIRRLAREGKIPAYKVGGVWRFNKSMLYRWAESQTPLAGGGRILIVDDDRSVREILGRMLADEGYAVQTASTGEEALGLMEREEPAAVLLDLKMPGMSGPAALKAMRSAYGDIPVIIITGYPDSDLMAETMQYSPVTLLPKPVKRDQMLGAVRLLLRGRGPGR